MSRRRKPEPQQPQTTSFTSKHSSGTSPDFALIMKPKDGSSGGSRVGVGWTNAKSGISLKLNTGVVISWRDCADYWFTLWPSDEDHNSHIQDRINDEVPF